MILNTLTHRLFVARNEADENGAAGAPDIFVLATEGNFAQMPSTALDLQKLDLFSPRQVKQIAEMQQNGIAFSFMGSSAAAKTFTYDIFTWGNENSPARHAVNGTGILGTQQVIVYPHNNEATVTDRFWADTLAVTWENWPKNVEATDEVGHNTVSEVWMDDTGSRYWFIQISDADGSTGTEAGDISVFYRYF